MLFKLRRRKGHRAIKKTLVPNIITAMGLLCGLFVIFKMNMTEPGESDYKVVFGSAVILLAAVLADFADGAVARLMRAESSFGGIFDALSDAITFGVAPAVMVLKTLSLQQDSLSSFSVTLAAMLYTLCGVLRLVRFSVITLPNEPEGDLAALLPMLQRKCFVGLPITLAASALASLNLFLASSSAVAICPKLCLKKERPLGFAMILLAYLMMSRLKFFSLKGLHFKKVPSFSIVVLGTSLFATLLMGLNHNVPLVCLSFTWGYIALALLLSAYYKMSGHRYKMLEATSIEELSDDYDQLS